jgi:cytidylate kinase
MPNMPISTIAIDGPAGSGKSTIGSALAARLGFLYFDTGVMYRCVALATFKHEINPQDEAAVSALAERIGIAVRPPDRRDGRQYTVLLDGEDVTWALRGKDVESRVSIVAAYPAVRSAMVAQQRIVAGQGRIVMVGRDIGTVVLPKADVKIYLTASAVERATRRHEELLARGHASNFEDVLAGVRQRDATDSQRATSPLRPANDAYTFDSTGMSVAQAIEGVYALVLEASRAHA